MSHISIHQFATRYDFEKAQAEHAGRKLVVYEPTPHDWIKIGRGAIVKPMDHPDTESVSNESLATTSEVEWYNTETGVFQTKNTRYVPIELVVQRV